MVRRRMDIRRLALPRSCKAGPSAEAPLADFNTVNQGRQSLRGSDLSARKAPSVPVERRGLHPGDHQGPGQLSRQVANMLNMSAQFLDPHQGQSKTFLLNHVMLISNEADLRRTALPTGVRGLCHRIDESRHRGPSHLQGDARRVQQGGRQLEGMEIEFAWSNQRHRVPAHWNVPDAVRLPPWTVADGEPYPTNCCPRSSGTLSIRTKEGDSSLWVPDWTSTTRIFSSPWDCPSTPTTW
jgi:hypothetical protein